MNQKIDRPRDRLLSSLLVEIFQAERSGAEHPLKEARRLDGTPPAQAMRAIAAHCERALEELKLITTRPELPRAAWGERAGKALSLLRAGMGDALVTRQASYRATLLGVHHGVDAILLLRASAEDAGDVEVVEWCMRTLDERRPLVEQAQHDLGWFGREPRRALEPAKLTLFARGARVLASGLESIGMNRSADR